MYTRTSNIFNFFVLMINRFKMEWVLFTYGFASIKCILYNTPSTKKPKQYKILSVTNKVDEKDKR